MSQTVLLPDDLYDRVAQIAATAGMSVETIVADLLEQHLRGNSPDERLDWSTASAEEIISALRASRVEREHPAEM